MTKVIKRLIVGSTILFSVLFFAGAVYAFPDTPTLPSEGSGPDLPPDPGGPSLPPFPELPPCPECDEFDGEPTPTPIPSEEPTPEATPTPDNDVCANIDGVQGGVPEGLHLDASGKSCVSWSQSGPPVRYDEGTGTGGQVLGASTLGATGAAEENIFYALFALGSILSGVGVRKFVSSKVR